ncbi:MAG: hypothetical protein GVY25_07235, partial [Bacteroidetes bacterium]|nr:hypothetical protein [Bacteroidota bacterium]
ALDTRLHTAASILPDIELNVPEAGGAFTPTNYDGTLHGPTPLRDALANSYNIPAVRVAQKLGAGDVLRTLRDVGLTSLDREPGHYGVGLTLGNGDVRPLHLARAYAGIARGGTLPGLRSVLWSRTTDGDTIRVPGDAAQPMNLSPGALRIVTDILSDPYARAEAFGRHGPLNFPFPVAAKTGTSKDYRDNWTAGFTPEHTVVVWVGNFDGSPMRRISGVTGAGPLFHAIVSHLGPGGTFPDPPTAGLSSPARLRPRATRAMCTGASPSTSGPAFLPPRRRRPKTFVNASIPSIRRRITPGCANTGCRSLRTLPTRLHGLRRHIRPGTPPTASPFSTRFPERTSTSTPSSAIPFSASTFAAPLPARGTTCTGSSTANGSPAIIGSPVGASNPAGRPL